MNAKPLHHFVQIPPGKTIAQMLPAFSGVQHEIHIGEPNKICGACLKPFNEVRKPRKVIRAYPPGVLVPVRFDVHICGACTALHRQGGVARDSVMAGIQAFLDPEEIAQ